MQPDKPTSDILNGWKEIAAYLGRGLRTVQRWEQIGLPVRRPRGSSRSAVVALSEELDAWLRAGPSAVLDGPRAKLQQPATSLRAHLEQHRVLRCRSVELCAANAVALDELRNNIRRLRQCMGDNDRLSSRHPFGKT